MISPTRSLDVPNYKVSPEIYKRARNIHFNPMLLMKVKYGNLRKRSLNNAISEKDLYPEILGPWTAPVSMSDLLSVINLNVRLIDR